MSSQDAEVVSAETIIPTDPEAHIDLVRKQVEYYFSRENLQNDSFLTSQMDSQNSVPIATVMQFAKLKALTEDEELIKKALETSKTVSIVDNKIKSNVKIGGRNTIILRDIPSDTPEDEILAVFKYDDCKPIVSVRSDIENTWFVVFESEQDAKDVILDLKLKKRQFRGESVKARLKSETITRSFYMIPPPQVSAAFPAMGFSPFLPSAGMFPGYVNQSSVMMNGAVMNPHPAMMIVPGVENAGSGSGRSPSSNSHNRLGGHINSIGHSSSDEGGVDVDGSSQTMVMDGDRNIGTATAVSPSSSLSASTQGNGPVSSQTTGVTSSASSTHTTTASTAGNKSDKKGTGSTSTSTPSSPYGNRSSGGGSANTAGSSAPRDIRDRDRKSGVSSGGNNAISSSSSHNQRSSTSSSATGTSSSNNNKDNKKHTTRSKDKDGSGGSSHSNSSSSHTKTDDHAHSNNNKNPPIEVDAMNFPPLKTADTPIPTLGYKGEYLKYSYDEIMNIVKDIRSAPLPSTIKTGEHPVAMESNPNLDLLKRQRTFSIDETREQMQQGRPVQREAVVGGAVDYANMMLGDGYQEGSVETGKGVAASAPTTSTSSSTSHVSADKKPASGSWAGILMSGVAAGTASEPMQLGSSGTTGGGSGGGGGGNHHNTKSSPMTKKSSDNKGRQSSGAKQGGGGGAPGSATKHGHTDTSRSGGKGNGAKESGGGGGGNNGGGRKGNASGGGGGGGGGGNKEKDRVVVVEKDGGTGTDHSHSHSHHTKGKDVPETTGAVSSSSSSPSVSSAEKTNTESRTEQQHVNVSTATASIGSMSVTEGNAAVVAGAVPAVGAGSKDSEKDGDGGDHHGKDKVKAGGGGGDRRHGSGSGGHHVTVGGGSASNSNNNGKRDRKDKIGGEHPLASGVLSSESDSRVDASSTPSSSSTSAVEKATGSTLHATAPSWCGRPTFANVLKQKQTDADKNGGDS